VAIVSESLARKAWPDQEAVGQSIQLEQPDGEPATVVGVVGDIRQSPMEEQYQPFVYLPFDQESETHAYLLVATHGKAERMTSLVQQAMHQVDPEIVPWRIETLREGLWRKTANAWAMVGLMMHPVRFDLPPGGRGLVWVGDVFRGVPGAGVRDSHGLGRAAADTLKLVLKQGLVLGLAGVGLGRPAGPGCRRVPAASAAGGSRHASSHSARQCALDPDRHVDRLMDSREAGVAHRSDAGITL
jgi:hypothetical protein